MKRIAVWGYGSYGKRMVKQIRGQWSDRYEITMVFDRCFEEINRKGEAPDPVMDPDDLTEFHRRGDFEAVMVFIAEFSVCHQVMQHLRELNVPIETIGRQEDYSLSFRIPGAEERCFSDIPGGYRYCILRGIYGIRSTGGEPLFLFDGNGHVLQDNWNNANLQSSYYRLDYPVPFNKKPAGPIRLQGPLCVVGKIWTSGNYWHFIYDAFDQVYVLEKIGYRGRYLLPKCEVSRTLAELMGIGPERILWQEDLPFGQTYCFEELVCVTQEKYDRAVKGPLQVEMGRTLMEALLRETEIRSYPSRLFVRRIGSRKLLKAEALLERYGFTEIIPEELSVREQMLHFHFADIVLCPHGANSTNSLFMHPGSAFIETFGKNWVNPCCLPTLFHGGVHYFPVVEWPIFSADSNHWLEDYTIHSPLLEMAIQNAICISGEEEHV